MTDPTITINAGFAAATDTATYAFYDVSSYDDGTDYAPDQFTHDLSPYLRDAFSISRGVNSITSPVNVADPGRFAATFNNRDRRFDPSYTSGPYVVGGQFMPGPGDQLTISATYNAVSYPLIVTYVDGYPQVYPTVGRDQTVPLSSTDALSLLAAGQINRGRPAELAGTRINAILNQLGWPASQRNIDPGITELGPIKNSSVSALAAMEDAANADLGSFFVSNDGLVTFIDRTTLYAISSTSATFGDNRTNILAGTELPFADVTMGYDKTLIYNDVGVIYNDAGQIQSAADVHSQTRPWGVRSYTPNLPFNDPVDARGYAAWIVRRFGEPALRINSLTIKPQRLSTTLFPQIFGRELGDRITVKITPLGGGSRISRDVFIRGIDLNYSNREWSCTWTFEDASWVSQIARYDVNSYDDGSVYAP